MPNIAAFSFILAHSFLGMGLLFAEEKAGSFLRNVFPRTLQSCFFSYRQDRQVKRSESILFPPSSSDLYSIQAWFEPESQFFVLTDTPIRPSSAEEGGKDLVRLVATLQAKIRLSDFQALSHRRRIKFLEKIAIDYADVLKQDAVSLSAESLNSSLPSSPTFAFATVIDSKLYWVYSGGARVLVFRRGGLLRAGKASVGSIALRLGDVFALSNQSFLDVYPESDVGLHTLRSDLSIRYLGRIIANNAQTRGFVQAGALVMGRIESQEKK